MIFVKPKKGVRVLDDLGREIPAKGKKVNKTTFIIRLIKEGSLLVAGKKEETPVKEGDK